MNLLNFPPLLVYGLGNPDRQDDGIGAYCVEKILSQSATFPVSSFIQGKAIFHLTIDELETAAKFSKIVVFDASVDKNISDFTFVPILPAACQQFTTHLLTPEEFLFSLIKLFDSRPEMYLISIRGYSWELGNRLTPVAKANADKAIEYFISNFVTFP